MTERSLVANLKGRGAILEARIQNEKGLGERKGSEQETRGRGVKIESSRPKTLVCIR